MCVRVCGCSDMCIAKVVERVWCIVLSWLNAVGAFKPNAVIHEMKFIVIISNSTLSPTASAIVDLTVQRSNKSHASTRPSSLTVGATTPGSQRSSITGPVPVDVCVI